MLNIENISYYYKPGQYAVQEVSLQVAAGEFVAVSGRNGSGKTTLTRLIMSLLKPVSGKITFEGADTAKWKPADMARHIGYVFQNPDRQIFRDTVAREISYGPEQLGFSSAEIKRSTEEAMAVTGLAPLAGSYPRTLSKGQKQRVAIASALAMQPRLLILDEPTSGQDASEKTRLMELLTDLSRQGRTIILVTHDMELLSRYSRRSVVMAGGRKVYDGHTETLFREHDVHRWGLREPAAAKIARSLYELGVPREVLAEKIAPLLEMNGGNRHA